MVINGAVSPKTVRNTDPFVEDKMILTILQAAPPTAYRCSILELIAVLEDYVAE